MNRQTIKTGLKRGELLFDCWKNGYRSLLCVIISWCCLYGFLWCAAVGSECKAGIQLHHSPQTEVCVGSFDMEFCHCTHVPCLVSPLVWNPMWDFCAQMKFPVTQFTTSCLFVGKLWSRSVKVAYNLLHKLGTKQEPLVRPGDRVSRNKLTPTSFF